MRAVKPFIYLPLPRRPFYRRSFYHRRSLCQAIAADQIPLPRLTSRRFLSPTPPQVPTLHPGPLVAQHPCRSIRTRRCFRPPPPRLLLTTPKHQKEISRNIQKDLRNLRKSLNWSPTRPTLQTVLTFLANKVRLAGTPREPHQGDHPNRS
uniref:Uncharacterized protein n=1 Tax=Setaria viridis TaxID=4556 RepID=A0A4U6U5F3_SETVI|nr:hypothetical protein SEVIR_6G144940v2 [Setaria viridis]